MAQQSSLSLCIRLRQNAPGFDATFDRMIILPGLSIGSIVMRAMVEKEQAIRPVILPRKQLKVLRSRLLLDVAIL